MMITTFALRAALLPTQDASIRDVLLAGADRALHGLLVMSGIVAIGIFFEIFEVWAEFRIWRESNPRKNWRPLLSLIGLILVIVGVFGEGIYEGLLGTQDTKLRDFDKTTIADSELKAAQANERASNAEGVAEAERLERTRLEERISPRWLTLEEQKEIGRGCQIIGASIVVKSYADDSESFILADQISNALHNAGFKIDRQTGAVGMGRPLIGINIVGPTEFALTISCLARHLRDLGKLEVTINGPRPEFELRMIQGALTSTGEYAKTPIGPTAKGSNIVIAVGAKPLKM
jgi:hypothetical protein